MARRRSGTLISQAFKFLKQAKRRQRPGRMSPWSREHVFRGHVRPGKTKGSGYHYRPGGRDFPGRRIVPGSRIDGPGGVYQARPEFFDPTINPPQGAWKPKAGPGGNSTFFPDHWTPHQVDAAIGEAFQNATPVPGTTRWRGVYRGVTIEGFYNQQGGLAHGWPVM